MPNYVNYNLLIAAPMLQDYLVDKDGTPMSAGTVTCYHDNSRTTLKNWYYQTGSPGNYTFLPLPNPLTLSAAGTIADANGNDTIPFFYPYSESDETQPDPYYITIANFEETNIITRENFPYNPIPAGNIEDQLNYENYIINNVFWRNIAPVYNNVTMPKSVTLSNQIVIAPSQHDGFRYPDIQFLRNNSGATDTLTIVPFPQVPNGAQQTILTGDITPEIYVNHVCSVIGTTATQKCYQFPISLHLNTLTNINFTATIQAQAGSSSAANIITLALFQDTGTGTTPPAPIILQQYTLGTSWTKYTFSGIFPATTGLSVSLAEDDGLYLQVQMPLNAICNINFCKPSIYLTTNTVPTNDFKTYDQIDSVISSPRTGDIRTSLNSFYNYGWVPMNDGTLGNISSNATAYGQQDAFPLFNLLWNLFKNYDNAGTNLLSQMYNSSGSPIAYGASAITDWNANNAISLTKMMGKVILGTVPAAKLSGLYAATFTGSGSTITPMGGLGGAFNGMPVYFIGTSTLSTTLIYYIGNYTGTTFQVFTTFQNAITQTSPQSVDSTGTIFSAYQGSFEGEYSHTQLLTELVAHTHTVAAALSGSPSVNQLNYSSTNASPTGIFTTSSTGSGTAFNVTQPGTFYNMFIKL